MLETNTLRFYELAISAIHQLAIISGNIDANDYLVLLEIFDPEQGLSLSEDLFEILENTSMTGINPRDLKIVNARKSLCEMINNADKFANHPEIY